MIYLNSKYLAKKLDINLAKWKRWSREFLDPDPLGGYRSGFARQFSYSAAFRVFLGGHLVAILKLTIPEVRVVLGDLDGWLTKNYQYTWPLPDISARSRSRQLYIYGPDDGAFAYAVRDVVDGLPADADGLHGEKYHLEIIGITGEVLGSERWTHARVVFIDTLYRHFIDGVATN